MAARHGPGSAAMQVASSRGEPAPDETSWTTTLVLESDTRFREEAAGVQAGRRSLVRDGERWASWDSDWGAVTSESEQEGRPALVDLRVPPRPGRRPRLLSARAPRAGRGRGQGRVARAGEAHARSPKVGLGGLSARPRRRPRRTGDRRRARSAAAVGGVPRRRAVSPARGRRRSPSARAPRRTFDLTLPEGVVASRRMAPAARGSRSTSSRRPHRSRSSCPSACPRAGGSSSACSLRGGSDRPSSRRSSSATRAARERTRWVSASAPRARPGPSGSTGSPATSGLEVADAGENVEPRHHVRVVRGGTLVELSGADRMLLIELARSLVPAPAEAPRLQ